MISSYQEDIKHQEGIQSRCNSESEQLVEQLEKAEQAEMETKEAELEGLVALTKRNSKRQTRNTGIARNRYQTWYSGDCVSRSSR